MNNVTQSDQSLFAPALEELQGVSSHRAREAPYHSDHSLTAPKRILVACPMKCGSTYVAQWLALYFGLERCQPFPYWGRTEQNPDNATMESLRSASFVLQLHAKPYVPLVRWVTEAQIRLVFLWRNIADALVSLDEHIRREDHRVPACYVHDPVNYSSLSAEERYEFLIRQAGPWYIQFYLMWKQAHATLPIVSGYYETLLTCPTQFFERLISGLAGCVDHDRLTTLVGQKLENTRFNQGLSGRSARLFSELNKWQLERLLLEYPEDLSDLVNELPWRSNYWRTDMFQYKENDISTDLLIPNDLADAPVGVISETCVVRQTFVCRRPGLTTIELLCATYGKRIPSGVVKVRLEHSGRAIRHSEVPLSSVNDNSWVQIKFAPITESAGCEFELIVNVAGMPEGCSFTIWASDLNPHRKGTLYFANEPRYGILCMRTACAVEVEQGGQRLQARFDRARQEIARLNNELEDLRAKEEQSEQRLLAQIDCVRQQNQQLSSEMANLRAKVEQNEGDFQENLREMDNVAAAFSERVDRAKAESQRQAVRLNALEARTTDVSQQTQEILSSRIWRTLCSGGSVLLSLAAVFRRKSLLEERSSVKNQVGSAHAVSKGSESSDQHAACVEELHLSHCDEPPPDALQPCSGKVRVRGWATAQSGIARVEIQLQDRPAVLAQTGLFRADIGRHLPELPEAKQSGFCTEIDTSGLSNGRYPVYIRTTSRAGSVRQVETVLNVDHDAAYTSDYDRWIAEFEERDERLMRFTIRGFRLKPLISILMPVYRTPPAILRRAIDSVIAQTYSNWELCIADDHSQSPEIEQILRSYAQLDPRIKVTFRAANGGIAAASNVALNLASGEYIALLDHDDELTPDALFWVVETVNRHPQADLLYSDEDKIDAAGKRFDPFFKPDWSPDLLLSLNYVAHLLVCRRQFMTEIGGFCSRYDGSQDYDLILRLTEKTQNILHIPKILYHWRALPTSTASGAEKKSYAEEAAEHAIQDHLERCGINARVEPGLLTGRWRVRYPVTKEPTVSIIVAAGGKQEALSANLKSVLKNTDYRNYEIVVIDNSKRNEIERLVKDISTNVPRRLRYIDWRHKPFNYSVINNEAARHCHAPLLLFLNDDTEATSADWLTAMSELAWRPEVGCVGAKLLYPDGRIQHAGVVMGLYDNCGHAFKRLEGNRQHYFDMPDVIRNVSAVTGACLMTKAEIFQEVGGFDEGTFPVAFNDIDLCLKIRERGYRVLYTPHAVLYHHEAFSKTGKDLVPHPSEVEGMRSKWRSVIDADPFYNPNLSRSTEDYSLRQKE